MLLANVKMNFMNNKLRQEAGIIPEVCRITTRGEIGAFIKLYFYRPLRALSQYAESNTRKSTLAGIPRKCIFSSVCLCRASFSWSPGRSQVPLPIFASCSEMKRGLLKH